MEGRTALIAAIVSGVLAVAVVTVDLQFGLDAEIQVMEGGEWVTVSEGDRYVEPYFGCVSRDLRLEVDNHRLAATDVDVLITYYAVKGDMVKVLGETWSMERGEVRQHEFTIPDSAFEPVNESVEQPRPAGHTVYVNVQAGDVYLNVCVSEEAVE